MTGKELLSLIVAAGILVLAACAGAPEARPGGLAFRADEFFAGDTRGRGELTYPSGRLDQSFTVMSRGSYDEDGQFVLRQIISWSDGDEQMRTFLLSSDGEGRWKGHFAGGNIRVTLTEEGSTGHLRHGLPGVPFARMEQFLYLQPDGRTVLNVGTVRVLGLPVRRLEETIEKTSPENE